MSQQPPQGPAGTPDDAARPDDASRPDDAARPGDGEPTEAVARSPYDVPPAGQTEEVPVGAPAPDYGQAPDPTRTIYAGATSTTDPEPEPEAVPGRPRWVAPVVIAVILLLVAGGVLAAFLLGQDDDDPAPVPPTDPATEEVTEPATTEAPTEAPTTEAPTEAATEEPTPTPEPTEASTELRDDLEESIAVGELTFELGEDGFTADDGIVEAGALEAWRGQYASGESEIELLATLWADNEAADAYAAELVEAVEGEQIDTGFTYTNETGTYWAFLLEDGRGSYVWTTDRGHVLQVIGSTDDVGGFYSNFPL